MVNCSPLARSVTSAVAGFFLPTSCRTTTAQSVSSRALVIRVPSSPVPKDWSGPSSR